MHKTLEVQLIAEHFEPEQFEVLVVEGSEPLGALFHFDVDVEVRGQGAISVDKLMGAQASLRFLEEGHLVRQVHGIVSHATDRMATEASRQWLRLRLSPRAYRMTMVHTQEVFLHMSVPEIIAQKLELCGVPYEQRLNAAYPKREYVVQYAETDLTFVSRLCEHLGIAIHFEHDGEHDRIVFSDAHQFFQLPSERHSVTYRNRGERMAVHSLECDRIMIPEHYIVADYNYRTPMVDLNVLSSSKHGHGGGVIEYGGHFKTRAEGEHLAQIRREAHECRRVVFRAQSDRADFGAGVCFQLEGHPSLLAGELLITEVHHHYVSVRAEGEEGGYHNSFKAIDGTMPYRPSRITPRPRISGVVSGIVEARPGADGTRPWLDKDGRYRVRLLFDTAGDEGKASRAVRMAQQHAGSGYGTHFPLRPGVEVLLVFIDGDVDRPIIIGAVPNAVTPTPVAEADHMHHRIQTASGIQIEFKDGF